jgi:hypothetical protein
MRRQVLSLILYFLVLAYLFPPWEIYGLARQGRASPYWVTARAMSYGMRGMLLANIVQYRLGLADDPYDEAEFGKAYAHYKLISRASELALKEYGVTFPELISRDTSGTSPEMRAIYREALESFPPEERKLMLASMIGIYDYPQRVRIAPPPEGEGKAFDADYIMDVLTDESGKGGRDFEVVFPEGTGLRNEVWGATDTARALLQEAGGALRARLNHGKLGVLIPHDLAVKFYPTETMWRLHEEIKAR